MIVLALAINVASAAEPATMTVQVLEARLEHEPVSIVVLDARSPAEFAAGHVPGARNVPHTDVAKLLPELEPVRGRTVVAYCRSGRRSAIVAEALRAAGFDDVRTLEGDLPAWQEAGYSVERDEAPAQ
jgi:rhodanese-related sulfurtransferase